MTATFEPQQPDVLVVRFDGDEDERDLLRAVEALSESTAPIVLDVSALALHDIPFLRAVCAHLSAESTVLVCNRLSGRRLLARVAGPGTRVFPTADDALTAIAGTASAAAIATPRSDSWQGEGHR